MNIKIFFLLTLSSWILFSTSTHASEHWDKWIRDLGEVKRLTPRPSLFYTSAVYFKDGFKPKDNKIALDLGAGIGWDTLFLLKKGFEKVITVDISKEAANKLQDLKKMEKGYENKLEVVHSSFEQLELNKIPKVDLINASFSLPFISKKTDYIKFIDSSLSKLNTCGYFVGNFFGTGTKLPPNSKAPYVTTSKDEILKQFKNFKILRFEDSWYYASKDKLFHNYTVIAVNGHSCLNDFNSDISKLIQ